MLNALFWSFMAVFLATALVTLCGVVKIAKVDDYYLKILVLSLLIEVVGAMILLFQKTDWEKLNQPTLTELRAELPDDMKLFGVMEISREIRTMRASISNNKKEVAQSRDQIVTLSKELEASRNLIGSLSDRVSILDTMRLSFPNQTINPEYPYSQQKRVANIYLQSIFKELNEGEITTIDGDGLSTKIALQKFESKYKIGKLAGILETGEINQLKKLLAQ